MPQQIVKRDGRIESWSVDRIAQAILKSLNASGIKDPLLAKRLAGKGATLTLTPEGFNVIGSEGPLVEGELERAARWASGILPSA